MSLLDLLTPSEEPSGDWPGIRAEATITARERIARYERERGARLAEYARKWPSPAEPATNLYRFSRAFRG